MDAVILILYDDVVDALNRRRPLRERLTTYLPLMVFSWYGVIVVE